VAYAARRKTVDKPNRERTRWLVSAWLGLALVGAGALAVPALGEAPSPAAGPAPLPDPKARASAERGARAEPVQAVAPSRVSLPVDRRTLANGLRVVMSPDRTVPTIALAVYYDVGSRNE
jgi:hypothetical protein